MSSTLESTDPATLPGPPPGVTFVAWPLRDAPWPVLPILFAAVALALIAGNIAGSLWFTLASLFALVAALWKLWLPMGIHVGSSGVVQTVLRRSWRISWNEITGYEPRRAGVLLFVDDDRSLLGKLGGIYIPAGPRREQILAIVKYHFRPRTAGRKNSNGS